MILLDVLEGLHTLIQLGEGVLIAIVVMMAVAGIVLLFLPAKPASDKKRLWSRQLSRWIKAGVLQLPVVLWLGLTIESNIEKNQNAKAAQQAKVAFGNSFVGNYCLNPVVSDSLMWNWHVDLSLKADSSYQLTIDRPRKRDAHGRASQLKSNSPTTLVGTWRLYWELDGDVIVALSGSKPPLLYSYLEYTKVKSYPYLGGALANKEWSRDKDRWLDFRLQKDITPAK